MQEITFDAVLNLPAAAPDGTIRYGDLDDQFIETWQPTGEARNQSAFVIHGGCWLDRFNCGHARPMCNALAHAGMTVFSLEYRRLGHREGGWPGTFEDVLAGLRKAREVSNDSGMTVVGHSAGGHLALWLSVQEDTDIDRCVALSAISDVAEYAKGDSPCERAAGDLLATVPDGIEISPSVLGAGSVVSLIHGERDSVVPLAQSQSFAERYGVPFTVLNNAGHFELIHPHTDAWHVVIQEVLGL